MGVIENNTAELIIRADKLIEVTVKERKSFDLLYTI